MENEWRGNCLLSKIYSHIRFFVFTWGVILALVLVTAPMVAWAEDATASRGLRIKAISKSLKGNDKGLHYHALVIGINAYDKESGWLSLAFPESDANRLVKLLKESYLFKKVLYLRGKAATRNRIVKELENFRQLTDSDALFIFMLGTVTQ